MVTVTSRASPVASRAGVQRGVLGSAIAAGCVLAIGVGLRLVLAPTGIGDRSAIVMAVLLTIGAWIAARLVRGSQAALLVTLALMALFDLAALPARNPPEYDEVQAFYTTDQTFSAELAVRPGTAASAPTLTLLVEPTFSQSAPRFGLAGQVNAVPVAWSCQLWHGIQHLALPVPAEALGSSSSAAVRLHLSGSPSRESDYLLVYASARRGGFLISLEPYSSVPEGATTCALV